MNEKLRGFNAEFKTFAEEQALFVCECSRLDCIAQIELAVAAFDEICSLPDRHANPRQQREIQAARARTRSDPCYGPGVHERVSVAHRASTARSYLVEEVFFYGNRNR